MRNVEIEMCTFSRNAYDDEPIGHMMEVLNYHPDIADIDVDIVTTSSNDKYRIICELGKTPNYSKWLKKIDMNDITKEMKYYQSPNILTLLEHILSKGWHGRFGEYRIMYMDEHFYLLRTLVNDGKIYLADLNYYVDMIRPEDDAFIGWLYCKNVEASRASMMKHIKLYGINSN